MELSHGTTRAGGGDPVNMSRFGWPRPRRRACGFTAGGCQGRRGIGVDIPVTVQPGDAEGVRDNRRDNHNLRPTAASPHAAVQQKQTPNSRAGEKIQLRKVPNRWHRGGSIQPVVNLPPSVGIETPAETQHIILAIKLKRHGYSIGRMSAVCRGFKLRLAERGRRIAGLVACWK